MPDHTGTPCRSARLDSDVNQDPRGSGRNTENCRAIYLREYRAECEPQTQRHDIIIFWSDEDHVFVAEIPELPGCMAHGETEESALKNVKEAIQLWIDTAREFGDPVPEPKRRRPL